MLVTTVTAMATDYVADCVVSCNNQESTMSGATMSVVDNGDGTYNITLKALKSTALGMDFGDLTLSNLSGTTEGGVTTISVTEVNAKFTSGDYMEAPESPIKSFVCKFNAEKLYANYGSGSMLRLNNWQRTAFTASFGTDEGFEGGGSTGGGETGGEDKPAIVDVVEADYAPNGAAFGFPFTINWETQKLVAKLDLSTCSRYTHNEGIITVGTDNGNGDVSLWNPNNGEANCHLYYTHYYYGSDEKLLNLHYLENPSGTVNRVDNSIQNLEPGLVVFTFDKDGLHVGDNLIATPDQMTTLYNSTSLIFGSKEGSTRSYATYKYVKVVPADWTETTEPEVTEVSSKSFEDKLYAFADGENIEQGNATVKISNMSDETIKMSLVFGDTTIESANIEQGTDDKGRTTYTGTADWEGVNFAVSAVVYTKDEAEKIYMTLTSNDAKYTVGTDPDYVAPEPPAGESTIVENWQSTEGVSWSHDATIDWNTQKLVVSVNLASTGSDKGFLGVTKKGQTAGWNNYGIIFYNTDDSTVQGYAPGQPNNANTNYITKGEDPVRFEISKDGGVKCQGNVVISAAHIAHLTNQSEIVVGAADKTAGALYNYIKVVPLDWTEKTEPEVKEEKTFNEALYMVQGTTSTKVADAKVVVKEMSDETINMSLQFNGNEYTSTELTKGTDTKGRTTYTGKVSKDTQTFDVAGVVYEKDNAERLYMTMTATGVTFVVGENPDAVTPEAVVYKNTLKIVRGTDTKTYEDAEVSVLAKGEGKYEVVLPEFSDMDSAEGTTPGTIGKLTFVADGVEADGKLKLTASSVETTQEGGEGWETQKFTASMDATVTGETLAGTFTVKVNGYESMYTYNLYYGVEAPEVVTEVANNNYTSNLRIIDQTSEDENTLFQTDEASVNIIKYSDNTYKITLRNITLNEQTSDLVFTGEAVGTEVDPDEGGAVVTEGTMVQATADAETQNFLGGAVNAQFMWQDLSTTEIRMSFVLEGATLSLGGEFNYEEETPDQPKDDYAINFDKDAKQNHPSRYSTSVSLQQTGKDKQTIEFGKTMNGYEDLTAGTEKFTVEAGSEVTPSIGYVGEWMHGYVYIDLNNDKQFSFNADGADQTGTEVVSYSYYKDQNSKGESASSNCNVNPMPSFTAPTTPGTYRIRFKVDWDNIDAGGNVLSTNHILNNGGGIYDATLEVVEPVTDGISTINAEAANGEAQLFTVDGVQIAKLQKGLNIVRTADGKVKKVLVK